MQHARVRKLNSLIRDQLSAIIYTECDWTHPLVMSITEVDTAPDLSHCKIKVAMLGELEQKKEAMMHLRKDSAHLRYVLAHQIEIRKMPLLQFELDEAIETEARVRALIDQVAPKG